MGQSAGVEAEWYLHNVGYTIFGIRDRLLGKKDDKAERCREVDIDKTLFHDTSHGIMSKGMHLFYWITSPVDALIDTVRNWAE